MAISLQRVRVHYQADRSLAANTGTQSRWFVYDSDPPPGSDITPKPVTCEVHAAVLQQLLEDVKETVERLVELAQKGQSRGELDLETALQDIAKRVLPAGDWSKVLRAGECAQLSFIDPSVAELPWEALSQLALRQHVSHLVTSTICTEPPTGNRFLIIADPTGDLTNSAHDPRGVCARHVARIHRRLKERGYDPVILEREAATVSAVLKHLRDPSFIGLYYFGHGHIDEVSGQGCLVMHKAKPLLGEQVSDARPRLKFAFLNACHAAAPGMNWGYNKPFRSVACAFAEGSGSKVVIAPIWRILNVQAARSADLFFRQALGGAPLAQALLTVRRASRRRYEKKSQPDISWAAYRYFGSLDRALAADDHHTSPGRGHAPPAEGRVFAADGKLNAELFSMPIQEILLRAAKRRIRQRRSQVSWGDLLAGVVRRGELLRYALHRQNLNPDELYHRLEAIEEAPAASVSSASQGLQPEDWRIDRERDFLPEVADLLRAADRAAQARSSTSLISELDLLRQLLASDNWRLNLLVSMPGAEAVLREATAADYREYFDENGFLILDGFARSARTIIDRALETAQWLGQPSIPSRLVFASFLQDDYGLAAERCRLQGADPELLAAMLILLTENRDTEDFRLGYLACERAILPMVRRARQTAGAGELITEEMLFTAFCSEAPEDFKKFLAEFPAPCHVDLGRLAVAPAAESALREEAQESGQVMARAMDESVPVGEDSSPALRLGLDSQGILRRAMLIAHIQGSSQTRSPHLFAALVGDGKRPLALQLRERGHEPEVIKLAVLFMVSPGPPAMEFRWRPSSSVSDVLKQASQQAKLRSASQIEEQDLLAAFFKEGADAVGRTLRELGADPNSSTSQDGPGASESTARILRQTLSLLNVDQDQFDESAQTLLGIAAGWAFVQGSSQVRSPHLFAALLADRGFRIIGPSAGQEVSAADLQAEILCMAPAHSRPPVGPRCLSLSTTVASCLTEAFLVARRRGSRRASRDDICRAYFSCGAGEVGKELARRGIRIDAEFPPEPSNSQAKPWDLN